MIELKVSGFVELEHALRRLPMEIAGKQVRAALKKAGQPLADQWRRTAPRSDRPEHGQHAADTIKVRSRTQESDADLEVQLWIGPDRGHFYLSFDEWGTRHQGASGVGRRAWDGHADRALSVFASELGAGIERAATRLAR